jgi:single-strand DNA-binding protein
MYLNKVTLIGNLTRDPELKALPSGMQVVSFSIATNRTWKAEDGTRKEAVEFHNCVCFGKQGENIARYMKKGSQLLVEGRLQTRSWDGTDGKKLYRTEIVVESSQFGNKPAGSTGGAPRDEHDQSDTAAASTEPTVEYGEDDINPEDIPF